MVSKLPAIVTGFTVPQNRYTPLFYLTWANFALFDYTEPVRPYPCDYLGTTLTGFL
jgi:hypothetical protein